jgi:metal-sulfur cluster biosynthetic enzyme
MASKKEKSNQDESAQSREEAIRKALTEILDPEIGIDVVNLGLIYKIEALADGHVEIDMTLTSMGCPIGPQFMEMVKNAAQNIEGVKSANVNLVFTPPWDPRTMASDDAKIMLGIY